MVKDDIKRLLVEATQDEDIDNTSITAEFFSKKLSVKRNTISGYLNDLCKSGIAIKINSRPVIFLDKNVLEKRSNIKIDMSEFTSIDQLNELINRAPKASCFDSVIGSQGSLFNAIERLKVAAGYPGIGLPVLITGSTGTGKTFLAKIFYDYCMEKGYLDKTAKFVHLNCAEYSDNPELLASQLFGYKKGSFTGAGEDSKGLFDEADGGILFLDEIHRLDAKGQEKLFRYLDNGTITPIGETKEAHAVKVRLVFATTEDISNHFLDTFIRRIPIQVEVPELNNRPRQERENLVKLFYLNQAKKINKNVQVNISVLNILSSGSYLGNVGQLKNTVLISVANSLQRDASSKAVEILLSDIPKNVINKNINNSNLLSFSDQFVSISPTLSISDILVQSQVNTDEIKRVMLKISNQFNKNNRNQFVQQSIDEINQLCDYLIFKKDVDKNDASIEFTKKILSERLTNIENAGDIKFMGNASLVLAYYFYNRNRSKWHLTQSENEQIHKITNDLVTDDTQLGVITEGLKAVTSQVMDLEMDEVDELFVNLFIRSVKKETNDQNIRCIILSHGYSTASSIAGVINELTNEHIMDAIDMPLDINVEEIGEKINGYISNRRIKNGLILMVDMGSLEGIQKYIRSDIDFPIAVVNNVSTQSALLVADDIRQHYQLHQIMEDVKDNIRPSTKVIYPKDVKKNLIITCCFTGIGTANNIKKLLTDSLDTNVDLEIQAFEVERLKDEEQINIFNKLYNIIAVVGTIDPGIENTPYISLESIISGNEMDKFDQAMSACMSEQQVSKFNDNLVHNFSLERVINSITILDAHLVMDNIDRAILRYSELSHKTLGNVTKMSLYVHISCLIERLIRNEPITNYDLDKIIDTNSKQMFTWIEESFSVIEKIYSVEIPEAEYGYIYDIIKANY